MVTINKEIIERIFDDKGFINEAYDLLNMLIDLEFEKEDDEVDFDFIDECSHAIIEISSLDENSQSELASILLSEKFNSRIANISKKNLSTGAKLLLIAAVLLASTISVSAAVGNLTGNSIAKETSTTVAEQTDKTESTSSAKTTEKAEKTSYKDVLSDDSEFVCKSDIPDISSQLLLVDCEKNEVIKTLTSYSSKGAPYLEEIKRDIKRSPNCDFDEEEYINKHCQNTKDCINGEYHKYGEWTVVEQPSCTELGKKERSCTQCDAVQECPVRATDEHDFTVASVIPPVFLMADRGEDYGCEDGEVEYICTSCNAIYKMAIPCVKYVVINANVFECDGKKHAPKVIAVLDRNMREVPSSAYKIDYEYDFYDFDRIKCFDDYSFAIDFDSEYYKDSTQLRVKYRIILPRTQIKGIASKKGSMTVFWKKSKLINSDDCTGYELQYSRSKDFSNAVNVQCYGNNATKKEIDGLVSGETYFVRMRAIDANGGHHGASHSYWSDVRKIRIK